jgi:putative transposase
MLAPESPETLDLMAAIDRLRLDTPLSGSRQMVRHLCHLGLVVGRKRVRQLMLKKGLTCIYRKPRTSDPRADHKFFPYLLRGLVIDRSNQVWRTDITYFQNRRGFLYLVAILDWASWRVLASRRSNTMGVSLSIEALDEAMGALRQAGHLQLQPGMPVHQLHLHTEA